jgi:hypothetical protein
MDRWKFCKKNIGMWGAAAPGYFSLGGVTRVLSRDFEGENPMTDLH